jgi:HAE1 family hydrophobic/amphiphilic exporter-1
MGTTVIGGMLAASVFGIFFIPAVFYLVERLSGTSAQRMEEVLVRNRRPMRSEGD